MRHIIVEGNYLLLDYCRWRDLAGLFDATIAVASDIDELRRRLEARWARYGIAEAEVVRKVEENDLPNARLVISRSVEPEFRLAGDFERAQPKE